MIGETVLHYRIVRQLGVGGMGQVYLAEDTKLRRRVALKVLSTDDVVDDSLERFKREARAVASLDHANIVTIFSVEKEGDLDFLTMEYVEGRTLGESIPPEGLPLNRILAIAIPLVDAVAQAHRRGVVHRDLKPSNVMLTPGGQPKILDFGLAKVLDDDQAADPTAVTELHTEAGMILGTAPYMSPEQLQGRRVDHRTDIFAIGVLLFEMTTGRRPFAGKSSAELVSSILRDAAPEISERRHGLPTELGKIIHRCLKKDPEERYESADELLRDLRDLRTTVVTALQPEAPRPPRRTLPRWAPWAAGAGAALVLALVAALWLARTAEAPAGDRLTLAILPFANLTGDASLDYLGQGLSAGLLTQLAEARSVRLVGRAATWSQPGEPARVARELGAGSMVGGEVQQEGSRLLVDVHLTDLGTGLTLWSERFEGDRESIMSLQRKIAERLVSVLAISLSRRELDRMARDPSRSFEAYEYFLRGFERLERVNEAGDARSAAALFRQALLLDPEFALAHAGLSEALWHGYRLTQEPELLTEAGEAARAAVEIDPVLPAAQVALARVARGRGQSAEAIAQLQTALANHPKPGEAYRELAASYEQAGDLESAEESLRAAIALKDDWYGHNTLGTFLARHGKYPEARAAFERAAERAPETVIQPQENLATLDLSQGNYDLAVAAFERLPGPIRRGRLASNIGTAYYYSTRPDKWQRAEEYYELAVELSPRHDMYRGNLADLYYELGREDRARASYRLALELVEEQLEANPEDAQLQLRRAEFEAKADRCGLAVRHAAALVLAPPQTGPKAYQLAKVFAVCGKNEAALDALALAKKLGAATDQAGLDREFEALAGEPAFQELIGSP